MADRYAVGASPQTYNGVNTAMWSATNGGAAGASVPGIGDDVHFTSLSPASIVQSGARVLRSLVCDTTGGVGQYTGNFSGSGGLTIGTTTENAGLYILRTGTGMTWSNTGTVTLANATNPASQLSFSGGATIAGQVVLNGMGVQGSYILSGNFINSLAYSIGSGFNGATFDPNGFLIGALTHTGGFGSQISGNSSTWLWISSAATTAWQMGNSGFTNFFGQTSTVAQFSVTANAQPFGGGNNSGGSKGYNILSLTVNGSTGSPRIADNNFFRKISFKDATNARTLLLTNGTTQVILERDIVGTSGKLMSINSDSAGVPAFVQSPRRWVVGANSTNVSGNFGMTFTAGEEMDYLSVKDIQARTVYASMMG